MKPETLKNIKKEISKYIPVAKAYAETTNHFPILTTIEVSLRNIVHDWSNCQDYTFGKDLGKVKRYVDFLRELQKVESDFHFVQYICEQVLMCYDGNRMSEDYEDEEIERTSSPWSNYTV